MRKRSWGRLGAAVGVVALLAGGLVGVAAPANAGHDDQKTVMCFGPKQMISDFTDDGDREEAKKNAMREKLLHIIKGGELELEERCEKLTEKYKTISTKVENAFFNQLMRLPKSVQNMPMELFKTKYGYDIKAACGNNFTSRSTLGKMNVSNDTVASSNTFVVPQTPSVAKPKPLVAFSAIKTSFVRRQREGGAHDATFAPKIELELTDAVTGKNIDANDPDAAKTLTSESKQEVRAHLTSLQSQIATLMEQFQ